MKKVLMLGAGLALLRATGVALAQPAPAPVPPPPAQAQAEAPRPDGMRGPGMHGRRHFGPPPSRAASFHIERGDTEVHIRCAENETMQACVAAASSLLDKVAPAR